MLVSKQFTSFTFDLVAAVLYFYVLLRGFVLFWLFRFVMVKLESASLSNPFDNRIKFTLVTERNATASGNQIKK